MVEEADLAGDLVGVEVERDARPSELLRLRIFKIMSFKRYSYNTYVKKKAIYPLLGEVMKVGMG